MPDTLTYRYRAVRIRQTATSDWLVLFGAPATDVDTWAGAPQKQRGQSEEETTGFQRDITPGRLEELKKFYADDKNIIQNSLLCATRDTSTSSVRFIPDPPTASAHSGTVEVGTIEIEAEMLETHLLIDLLKRVKADLERRVPSLASRRPSAARITRLKQLADSSAVKDGADSEDEELSDAGTDENGSEPDATAIIFSDESHIFDFWEDITARIIVLEESAQEFRTLPVFEGYSKDAMVSFLRAVIIVDGQHRLRGAVEIAKALMSKPPHSLEIDKEVLAGRDPAVVQREVGSTVSRTLPVSLLMTDDPAEHVFQFVVVNQKATPIDRALLGTIVSTSLSNDELLRVSRRLSNAGIPLQESRSIAYLTRHPDSPFYGLVERGLASDDENLMPWSVLGSLIKIFQRLRGGRLYNEKNDYADRWRRQHLNTSPMVADWAEKGYDNQFAYWSAPDGPWRAIFVRFWREIRDRFGSRGDPDVPNNWGAGRDSNLFNKISLTILAADFFQYLCEAKRPIDSDDAIPELVTDWLKDVNVGYFNRPWPLSGVKKDSTGIRNRWSKLWSEYRKDPQRFPAVKLYRSPLAGD